MTNNKTEIIKDSTYYHPKELTDITIECFISHLRNKRKKGEETPTEFVLEGNLRDYLNERNKTNEPFLTEEKIEDKFPDAKMYFLDFSRVELGEGLKVHDNAKPSFTHKCTFCDTPFNSHLDKLEGQAVMCEECENYAYKPVIESSSIELPNYTAMILKSEGRKFDEDDIDYKYAESFVKDVIFNLKKQKLI